jgi:hypothetical protein
MTSFSLQIKSEHFELRDLEGHIAEAYGVLSTARDLSPKNAIVSETLSRLVDLATALVPQTNQAAANDFISSLGKIYLDQFRGLLGRAESEMERYWSAKFFTRRHINYNSLSDFIYWDNYQILLEKELQLLKTHTIAMPDHSCFVGQGPLPMTMLIYAYATGAHCTGVDVSQGATTSAERLSNAIQAKNCFYIREDGREHDYSLYDMIFIASLVPSKDDIIEKIKKDRSGKTTYIMVRTVEQLMKIFYEPYHYEGEGLALLGMTEYASDCLNTTLLYRYN